LAVKGAQKKSALLGRCFSHRRFLRLRCSLGELETDFALFPILDELKTGGLFSK
jgi:hypothetical protein